MLTFTYNQPFRFTENWKLENEPTFEIFNKKNSVFTKYIFLSSFVLTLLRLTYDKPHMLGKFIPQNFDLFDHSHK